MASLTCGILKKMVQMNYLHNGKGVIEVENTLMVTRKGAVGEE